MASSNFKKSQTTYHGLQGSQRGPPNSCGRASFCLFCVQLQLSPLLRRWCTHRRMARVQGQGSINPKSAGHCIHCPYPTLLILPIPHSSEPNSPPFQAVGFLSPPAGIRHTWGELLMDGDYSLKPSSSSYSWGKGPDNILKFNSVSNMPEL